MPPQKTPEEIARLPPKLRTRLLERGIITEEQVVAAIQLIAGGSGVVAAPAAPVPPPCPGTPPELPPGLPPGSPGGSSSDGDSVPDLPPGLPPDLPPGLPPGSMPDSPPESPPGLPPDLPPGLPPGMSTGAPSIGFPADFPPGLPPGMPHDMPPGLPSTLPSGFPPAMQPSYPPGLPPSVQQSLQPCHFDSTASPAADTSNQPAFSKAAAPSPDPPPGLADMEARMRAAEERLRGNPLFSKAAEESPPAPKAMSQMTRSVYSSAPVLNSSLKRPPSEAPAEEPDAKRQSAAEAQSPALVRAAEAQAAGVVETPVWVYKDGVVTEQGAPAQVAVQAPAVVPAATTAPTAAATGHVGPPPPGPPPGKPLPPGWVQVPADGDFYYWNTMTNETSWEHPLEPKEPEKKQFVEEHKVLWTDLGKVIGARGMNLKIIKASIGCTISCPKQGKGKGGKGKKGKDGKDGKDGKGKGKGKEEKGERGQGTASNWKRGAGATGANPNISDDQFALVTITGDTAMEAKGGKRCIEVMLGYGRNIERALQALGVEMKLPKEEDEIKTWDKKKNKDELDPMDPASYSEAPQGSWSSGMSSHKKPEQKGGRSAPAMGRPGEVRDPAGLDSKTANAERF